MIAAPNARVQARSLARRVAQRLRRTGGILAVPGGTTPVSFFEALAREDAGWRRVTVTLTDERWVPRGDAASNERQARAHLLQAQARRAAFLPWKTAHASPAAAARFTGAQIARRAPIEICVLGMGEDGHIASLFPGHVPEARGRSRVIAVHVPGAAGSAARLSLSLRAILEARLIVILLRGREKLAALRRWLAPAAPDTPIRALVQARRGPLWLSWSP